MRGTAALPRLAVAYLAAQTLLLTAYPFVPHAAQVGVFGATLAAAPLVVAIGAHRNVPAGQRGAWRLIALALVVFALSDGAFDPRHLGGTRGAPFAVGACAVGYLCLSAGVLLLVGVVHGGWDRPLLVEVAILALAVTLVEWVLVAAHGEGMSAIPARELAPLLGYALADGVVLAAAGHVLIASARRAPASVALFAAALALLAADEAFALRPAGQAAGSWPDIGWAGASVLFAVAASMPSAGRLEPPSLPALGMPVLRLLSLGAALAALPALLVLSAMSTFGGAMHAVLAAGALVVLTLVPIRVAGLARWVVRVSTDELEARRRTEAARNRLAALIGSLQAGVLLEDVDGRVVVANEAFCRIFDRAEEPSDLVGALMPHAGDRVADLVADPGAFEERATSLTRDRCLSRNEQIDLLDGRSFLRDHIPVFQDGSYEGSLWHYLDVTERRQAERELAEAHEQALETTRLKSEFLAVMSHEIRTPMYGVIGATDLLDQTALDHEQHELTRVLRDSAEALLALLNDILDLSKIEADRLTLVDEELDLAGLVDATLDALASEARRKDVWLSAHVHRRVPETVRGDALRVRQILVNLVGNAIKFTSVGEVAVSAEVERVERSRVGIRLIVTDTGIGIPKPEQARLFEPFTQLDASRTRTHPGSGLGLAICNRLADLMDGSISCRSRPGCGTTMTAVIFLGRVPTGDDAPPARPLAGRRAVLVGAAPLMLGNLAATLEDLGMATSCHTTLEEARAAAEEADVVLSAAGALTGAAPTIRLSTEPSARRTGGVPTIVLPVARHRLLSVVRRALEGVDGQPPAPSPVAPTAPVPVPVGTGAVLVVEDNEINRSLTMRQLARLGVAARSVSSGSEALLALERGTYGAVLMDCRMPGMDGFATTRAVRAREKGTDEHVPVIAITAEAQPRDRQLCLDAGMDDYLAKPLTLDELASCLTHWLELSRRPAPAAERAIDVDPLVAEIGESATVELIELWCENLPAQLASLQRAIEDGDTRAASAVAHVLKSTSGALGARRTARLAARLESAARERALGAAETVLAELIGEADSAMRELEARLVQIRERADAARTCTFHTGDIHCSDTAEACSDA